jgi:hypothetical protein
VQTQCAWIAGSLQYFFLASFAWMADEGLQIYLKLVLVWETNIPMKVVLYSIGYGVPAIIVLVSALVKPSVSRSLSLGQDYDLDL